jgi:cellulase (glycosyl hydrolase family 5)/galactose oxidase-like protein
MRRIRDEAEKLATIGAPAEFAATKRRAISGLRASGHRARRAPRRCLAARVASRSALISAIVASLCAGVLLLPVPTALGATSSWTAGAAGPPATNRDMLAYDAATGTDVLFGGGCCPTTADTWTWDGSTWTQQDPSVSPPARESGAMAYDPDTQTVVLFGGDTGTGTKLNDTWTWNGSTWTQQHPTVSPPARSIAAMAWDPVSHRIILFGGWTGDAELNDTWAWDGTNWTLLTPSSSPSPRGEASVATDTATQTIVLFGGEDEVSNSTLDDTWVWNGSTWTQRTPGTSPPARSAADMAYSPSSGEVVLFGGGCCGYPAGTRLGDTWTWDGSDWFQESTSGSPPARNYGAMATSPDQGVFMFGGAGSDGALLSDAWTWAAPADATPFVRDCGTQFCLGTRPFRFTGWNTYELAFPPGCATDLVDVAQDMQEAAENHVSVIRFWLYQDTTASGTDFSTFDSVIALAHQYGLHLLPVFEDGNGWPSLASTSCMHERSAPDDDWYGSGYLSPYGGFPISYKDYVSLVVQRYANEPAIFAWQLMNEPRDNGGNCDESNFYNFFADMTNTVRSLDPNHLINSGSGVYTDPGFSCSSGPDTYQSIYSLPNNNFAEFHDYDQSSAMPTDVQDAIDAAQSIGKPIIAGEMGITGGSTQAAQYDAKMSAAFAAGVAGYIPWEYQNVPSSRIQYAFGPTSAVLPVIAKYGCGC